MLRFVHVAAAVLLLGNVVVTGIWSIVLYRRRAVVPFREVARVIMIADVVCTLGGGAALTISGILLTLRGGYRVMETPWLLHGIGALALATLLWLVVLLPDQLRMERHGDGDELQLRRWFWRWNLVGWLATAVLFGGLWSMVAR